MRLSRLSKYRFAYQSAEEWIWTEVLEKDIRNKFWHVMPGQIVFDIGADFGSYTIPAIADGGFVYAFEPRPEGARALQNNLVLNGFQDRCKILQVALASPELKDYTLWMTRPTSTPLLMNFGKSEMATILPGYFGGDSLPVTTTTIDEVVKQYKISRVDWIKMDVEGAELMVIGGGVDSIRKFKPSVLIECHNDHDKNRSVETKVLEIMYSLVPDYQYNKEYELFEWLRLGNNGNPHMFFSI